MFTEQQTKALMAIAPEIENLALRLTREVGSFAFLHMFSSSIAYAIANAAPNADVLKHSLEVTFELMTDQAHQVFNEKKGGR